MNAVMDGLRAFQAPPPWLAAAADASQVADGLRRAVPEFTDGRLRLEACRVEDLRLRDNHWIGRYTITIEGLDGEARDVTLTGTLDAHGAGGDQRSTELGFASTGWSVALPDPPLTLIPAEPDRKLRALPLLTRPASARAWVERTLRETYPGIRVVACDPVVTRYRPGQRCTVVCHLAYAADADPSWPEIVVAKLHRAGEGARGHAALQALAAADVGRSSTLDFARALAYVPEDDVAVQSYLPEDRSLSELVARASTGGNQAMTEAADALGMVAGALAALHRSPVRDGPRRALADEIASARSGAGKLATFPGLVGAVDPLLHLIEQRAALVAADDVLSSHGAFRPAQVRLSGGRVGLLDLDGFSQCEPGQDVGRFVGKLRLLSLRAPPAAAADLPKRLAVADHLAASFLDRYREEATVSPIRVTLWETLDLVKALLQSWSRGRPAQIDAVLTLLEARAERLRHRQET